MGGCACPLYKNFPETLHWLTGSLIVAQMASESAALEAQLSSGYIIQEYEKD